MSAVIGYTLLLAQEISGPVTQVQRDHLRRVRLSSEHVLALIEQLLHVARLDASKEMVNVEPVRAADIVQETIDIISPIAELKGSAFASIAPPSPSSSIPIRSSYDRSWSIRSRTR